MLCTALLSVATSPSDHSGKSFSEFTNVSAWGPSGQPWASTLILESGITPKRSLLSHELTLIGSGDLWKVILFITVC